MEDAGLVALGSGTLGALLQWATQRLRASIDKTAAGATDAIELIDLSGMREELDVLNKFKADWESSVREADKAERRAMAEENAELKRRLGLLEESSTSMVGGA